MKIESYPIIKKCYLFSKNVNNYRSVDNREIVGLRMVKPSEELEKRLCYDVEFEDGERDYIPVSEIDMNYDLVTSDYIIKNLKLKRRLENESTKNETSNSKKSV